MSKHDDLAAARGIVRGVCYGLVIWAAVALIYWITS